MGNLHLRLGGLSLADSPVTKPHHDRFERAWTLYRDDDLSDHAKRILLKEMGDARTDFTFLEFLKFKQSLPGYVEYWAERGQDLCE